MDQGLKNHRVEIASAVERVGDHWEQLRGGRVFITGGTGFFGKWLLDTFVAANVTHRLGAEAVVLTREPARWPVRDGVTFHAGDIRTYSPPHGKFTHVIHAATPADNKMITERPDEMRQLIVEGTRRTLDVAEKSGAKNFLLTSSGAVYGRQPLDVEHVIETQPLDPNSSLNAYAAGKREAEALLTRASILEADISPRVARCFAFIGPHLPIDAHYAVGNFLRDALNGGTIRVAGDGTPLRSYLYAADLATWLWAMALDPRARGIYNVGSDESVSIADLARKVGAITGAPVEIAGTPIPGRAPERYVPSIDRARNELELEAWTSLDDSIRLHWEFLKAGHA